jgi:hypothetical protein
MSGGPPTWVFTNDRRKRGIPYDEGDIDAQFVDVDNDGDVDVAICSTYPMHFTKLYRNDGTGHFTDVTFESGIQMHQGQSMAFSDLDDDGDLDLVEVGATGPGAHVMVMINHIGEAHAWVVLQLRSTKGNRDAINAKVTLRATGKTQIREVKAGGGTASHQSSKRVHFGLGGATSIDEIVVRWPGGASESFAGVTPKGRFELIEGTGRAAPL